MLEMWWSNEENNNRKMGGDISLSEVWGLSGMGEIMPQKKMTKAQYAAYLEKRNAKNKKDPNVLFGSSSAWLKKNL